MKRAIHWISMLSLSKFIFITTYYMTTSAMTSVNAEGLCSKPVRYGHNNYGCAPNQKACQAYNNGICQYYGSEQTGWKNHIGICLCDHAYPMATIRVPN